MFDKDGDGTISAAEIMIALQSTGAKTSEDDLNQLLQEFDVDGRSEGRSSKTGREA